MITEKKVFHKVYGEGTVVETVPAGGLSKAKIRVNFKGHGVVTFVEDLFTAHCRFADSEVQCEFENELKNKSTAVQPAAENELKDKSTTAQPESEKSTASQPSAGCAECKAAAPEINEAENEENAATDLKIRKILERAELRHRKEEENKAAEQAFNTTFKRLMSDLNCYDIYLEEEKYSSVHPDSLITESEFNTMAAYLVNKYKYVKCGKQPALKYKYSLGTVRKCLKDEFRILNSRRKVNYSTFVFFLCTVSYLHKANPLYKDISLYYDTFVLSQAASAA